MARRDTASTRLGSALSIAIPPPRIYRLLSSSSMICPKYEETLRTKKCNIQFFLDVQYDYSRSRSDIALSFYLLVCTGAHDFKAISIIYCNLKICKFLTITFNRRRERDRPLYFLNSMRCFFLYNMYLPGISATIKN